MKTLLRLILAASLTPAAAFAVEPTLVDQFGDALGMVRQGRLKAEAASDEDASQRSASSQIDEQTAGIAEKALSSVVTVVTTVTAKKFSLLALALRRDFRPVIGIASGTGWIVRADGLLVTNAHVVGDDAVGSFVIVQFRDHLNHQAKIVAKNVKKDLALLQIDSPRKDWPVLTFGDSAALRRGQRLLALGSARGLRETLTVGSFSRSSVDPDLYPGRYLQTDAAINHGNSGGPLLDMSGRVVGVNFAIRSDSTGIGWAIPVEYVSQALKQYAHSKALSNARLGIVFEDSSMVPESQMSELIRPGLKKKSSRHDEGAWIAEIETDSPAKKGGLLPGDRIVAVNSVSLPVPATDAVGGVYSALSEANPGDSMQITYVRGDERKTVSLSLDEDFSNE